MLSRPVAWFLFILIIVLFGSLFFYHLVPKPDTKLFTLPSTPDKERIGDASIYPDLELTPGDIFLDITTDQICHKGYTSLVRYVTNTKKKEVYELYGYSYPQPLGDFQVDHFIPLSIGGSNDIKNLWPQPDEPHGYKEKRIVDVYIKDVVCKGYLTISQAQEWMKHDWYAVYLQIPDKSKYIYTQN